VCAYFVGTVVYSVGSVTNGVDAENCTLTIITHTFTIAKTAHVSSNNNTASPMLPHGLVALNLNTY
jgi:hypothetical protein